MAAHTEAARRRVPTARTGRFFRMTEKTKDNGWKFLQSLVLVAVPVLFTCVGYAFNSIQEHATKIAVIESTRYTAKDAEMDRKAFQAEMKALLKSYDPAPMRGQLYDLGTALSRVESQVSDLARRADAVERKGK